MKRSRFTETQIVKAIQEHENGRDAKDICRELGITTVSFYKWRQRYGGATNIFSAFCSLISFSSSRRITPSFSSYLQL